MIDLSGQVTLPYFEKGPYTGSYLGMRYRIGKTERDGEKLLTVTVYPEPFCFESTPDEEKESSDFPFSDEGFKQAVDWLNGEYDRQKPRWDAAG